MMMMEFFKLPKYRTFIDPSHYPFKVNYQTPLFFLGSCFSENIGGQLQNFKFPVLINPVGTVYNPASIVNSLKVINEKKIFSKDNLEFSDNKYFNYLFNTQFSGRTPEIALRKMNTSVQSAHHFLEKTNIVFITLGTSFAYCLNKTNEIVSNCHKQSDKLFTRILLNVETTMGYLEETIRIIGNDKKIVFTVSPIRHLKDGLIENQHSKAQLIVAIHQVIKKYDNIFYFPSYEIMMDDLRDYRYYDESLTHLSQAAIQYIFHHFAIGLIDRSVFAIMQEIDKFKKQLQHKTRCLSKNDLSEWKKKLEFALNRLAKKYPFLDFSEERIHIANRANLYN